MKKFLLSLAAVALAAPAMLAQDYYLYMQFEGGANAYKNVTIQNFDEEIISVTGNDFKCPMTTNAIYIMPANEANIVSIAVDGQVCNQESDNIIGPNNAYVVQSMYPMYMIGVYSPAAIIDSTFVVTVEGGLQEGDKNLPLYLATGNNLSAPAEDGAYMLTGGEDTDIWTGTFTIAANSNFRFVRSAGESGGETGEEGGIVYTNVGPQDETELLFTASVNEFNGSVFAGVSGYWNLATTEDCNIQMTVDLENNTVTFVNLTELTTYDVNLVVEGVDVEDAYKYVTASYVGYDETVKNITFTSAQYTIADLEGTVEFTISSNDESYMISDLLSDNEEAAEIEPLADGSYNIIVTDACTLSITVEPVAINPPVQKVAVTYAFVGLEGLADPQDCIVVTYNSGIDEEMGEVNFADGFTYTYETPASIEIEPAKGYAISNVYTNAGDNENVVVVPSPVLLGQWGVSLLAGAPEEVTVTIEVGTEDVVSGVEGIFSENGETVIYNLQGVRVNAEKLPAGIYIVNGKKMIVNK